MECNEWTISPLNPGTAAVESDFSVLKFEKNVYWTALLGITLEGILHCKQFKALLKA
jgi:hypothetical protein